MTTGEKGPDPVPATPPGPRARTGLRSPVAVLVMAVAGALLVGALVGRATAGAPGGGAAAASPPAVCQATTVAGIGLPSVVTVSAQGGPRGPAGTGSGEIFADGGYILTNDHVIAVAANGGAVSVRYSDGRSSPATIVGRDVLTDLAVLKAADGASGFPVIARGSSSGLAVGQPVVALGAPLGLVNTVTSGIVSALDREVSVPADAGGTAHLVGAVQTDAAINPGNSGGPLVNCQGELVGVNTAIATVPGASGEGGGGSVGLGFAIPVDLAVPIAGELIATGSVAHYSLGLHVRALPGPLAERVGLPPGLVVEAVDAGGPADRAGIRALDVLTSIDGKPAVSAEQVTVAELAARSSGSVAVAYTRAGRTATVTLTPVPFPA